MQRPAAEPEDSTVARSPLRFELVFASIWLAFGLFILPAAIFFVGQTLLGSYGEDGSLGRFYADFYADLAIFSGRAWALALGPVILVSLTRLIFIGARAPETHAASRSEPPPSPPPPHQRSARKAEPRRIEPSLGTEDAAGSGGGRAAP